MAKRPKPNILPFNKVAGLRKGAGKDNDVFELAHPAAKPHERVSTGYVIKVSHEQDQPPSGVKRLLEDKNQAAIAGNRYKKNKYEILKHFLGDAIPGTMFVTGDVYVKGKRRPAEYTIQQEVPQFSLSDLSEEQRSDPRLLENMKKLMTDMEHMYYTLGKVNARTNSRVNLDGKLDLGGVSDFIRTEVIGKNRHVSDEDVLEVVHSNSSPNLLIDPDSMQPYCIDFDQGEWVDGMDEAKKLAFELDEEYRSRNTQLGSIAFRGAQLKLFEE